MDLDFNDHNFKLLLHTEKIYNTRINYFVVFQSIFFASYFNMVKHEQLNYPMSQKYIFLSIAILLTIIWIIIDCRTYRIIGMMKKRCEENHIKFVSLNNCVPINFFTGIIIPFVLFLMWVVFLIIEIVL